MLYIKPLRFCVDCRETTFFFYALFYPYWLCLCDLMSCGKNIRVMIIYLTQRTQRARSFNFHTACADAEEVASFTATGERKGRMANEYTIQPLVSAYLCDLLSCVASDLSSDSVNSKIFALSATSACGKKTSVWWLYVSRKERREHRVLISILFALALEWS